MWLRFGATLAAGITGLQWVVGGYMILFGALLLSAGSLSARFGARRAFGTGVAVFISASTACCLVPNLGILIAARLVQSAAAAVEMPSSMALIRHPPLPPLDNAARADLN